jgi:hypothetical protein
MMNEALGRMRSLARTLRRGYRDRLVDSAVDTYVEWREESQDVRGAYQRWAVSGLVDRELAFRAYHAALDREEKAALVHGFTVERLVRRATS